MLSDGLSRALFAPDIDLRSNGGEPIGRGGGGNGNHPTKCLGNSGKIGLYHNRQPLLRGNHMSPSRRPRNVSSTDPQATSSRGAISRKASRLRKYCTRSTWVRRYDSSCPSDQRNSTRGGISISMSAILVQMRPAHAKAEDPVIGGIASEMALGACDARRRRAGSAHHQAAEIPYRSRRQNGYPPGPVGTTLKSG